MSENYLYILLNGFKWPAAGFPAEYFHQVINLGLGAGDLVLNTYPKCGTNWIAYMIWEIVNNGAPLPQPDELLGQIMPFVDRFGVGNFVSQERSDSAFYRMLITHIGLSHFPYNKSVKYVAILRNPFDCCVSFYHFMHSEIVDIQFDLTFDDFFEKFLRGDMIYGDYFDHLLLWYERRGDSNVKIVVYEEVINDRKKCVLELARFLGNKYAEKIEESEELLARILNHTSFEHMKANLNYSGLKTEGVNKKGSEFIRKGIVGDWKTMFSEDQKIRLKEKMQEKLKGTTLLAYWLEILHI